MLHCPLCGSERVILLTFDQNAEIVTDGAPDRPLAKCVTCAYRLTAQEVMNQMSTPRN